MMTCFRILALLLLASAAFAADPTKLCVKPEQAANFVGKNICVSGKVFDVGVSHAGTYFLDFCEDRYHCPFTAVAFPHSAKRVGDLRVLKGYVVEIRGKVKEYKGQPEIIINSREQIKSEALIPTPPPEFRAESGDASNTGRSRRSGRDRAW